MSDACVPRDGAAVVWKFPLDLAELQRLDLIGEDCA